MSILQVDFLPKIFFVMSSIISPVIFDLDPYNAYISIFRKHQQEFGTMPTISACRLDFLIDDETKLIGFISAILQISEYELFRIAHQYWFNQPISETRLDILFKDYLANGSTPYWVNDFARKAHEKFKAGELNYKDYGIKRRVCDRKTKIKGWLLTVFLLILMVLYSIMITWYPSY
jgi:hypothetical protein